MRFLIPPCANNALRIRRYNRPLQMVRIPSTLQHVDPDAKARLLKRQRIAAAYARAFAYSFFEDIEIRRLWVVDPTLPALLRRQAN